MEMKKIKIQDFWKSERNFASFEDILAFCTSVGLRLEISDEINLKNELFMNK